MRFGMLPQDSTLSFDGPIGPADPPADARTAFTSRPIDLATDQPVLAALDLATVGFARPTDHEFWTGVPGLHARILERDGSARGYAYVSSAGAVGPIAVTRPDDLGPPSTWPRSWRRRAARPRSTSGSSGLPAWRPNGRSGAASA